MRVKREVNLEWNYGFDGPDSFLPADPDAPESLKRKLYGIWIGGSDVDPEFRITFLLHEMGGIWNKRGHDLMVERMAQFGCRWTGGGTPGIILTGDFHAGRGALAGKIDRAIRAAFQVVGVPITPQTLTNMRYKEERYARRNNRWVPLEEASELRVRNALRQRLFAAT